MKQVNCVFITKRKFFNIKKQKFRSKYKQFINFESWYTSI